MNYDPLREQFADMVEIFSPRSEFCDDDWVIYDKKTLEVVRIRGSKMPRPQAMLGQCCVSGMSARFLGLRPPRAAP